MMCAAKAMNVNRAGSSVLLAGGVVLVFAGLSTALGFSIAGMIASAAAITALLYAGGVWFGETPRADPSLVLFTPELIVASGPLTGRPIAALFPDAMRREVEAACRAALDGRASSFACGPGTDRQIFEASAVRTVDGAVVYGLLLSGALVPAITHGQMTPLV
jgi:hypothetical protein